MSDPVATRPRPTTAPTYRSHDDKLSEARARSWGLDDVVDAVFFAVAALATVWLAWAVIGAGWHVSPWSVLAVVLFWALLAYLAIPRLHQVLTWLYVPDYFIGRTRTTDGVLGDPVNLAVLGDEDDIHEAMTRAGWVRADPITPASSWRIVVSSLTRRSYPAAPVSTLTLFGRGQDFAYQKEVEGNPAQRHHVRFWHTPAGWVLPGGRVVDWLGGATYDRSVGLSTLTGQVTHKIDANIDIERNYVVDDVMWASREASTEVWPDFFTAYHDRNGGGDRIETDGDLYVLNLHDVVVDDVRSVDLARARALDARASRQRPGGLLVGLALVGLAVLADAVRLLSDSTILLTAQALRDEGVAHPEAVAYWVVIGLSSFMTTLLAVLAWASWVGHPRSRTALLTVLTLSALTTAGHITTLGVRHATLVSIAGLALEVLALLALTERSVQRWQRHRKAERRRRRAQQR